MADVPGLTSYPDVGNLMASGTNNQLAQQAQVANTGVVTAQAGLTGQQAQAAQMQNQLLRARLPLVLHALQDSPINADASGAHDADPDHNPIEQAKKQSAAAPNHGDEPWYNLDTTGMRQRYFVNPAGTPQDFQQLLKASLADPKDEYGLLAQAKMQKDLGVQTRLAQSQKDANDAYETMNAVSQAPDGLAMDALEKVSPSAAARIRAQIPDATAEDAAARQFASHYGAEVHQYTGREVVAGDDGVFRDKVTQQAVAGLDPVSLTPEQWTNLANHGTELVDVKQTDGSTKQVPRYIAEGVEGAAEMPPAKALQAYIERAAGKRNLPGAAPTLSGAPSAQASLAASTAAQRAISGTPKQSAPPGAAPAPPSPVATKGADTPAPMTPKGGAPAIVPGLDLNSLPKTPITRVVSNSTPSIDQQEMQKGYATERMKILKEGAEQAQNGAQNNALLTQFQNKLDHVNPRDVGPGSSVYKTYLDMKAAVTGRAPNDLVDIGVLDKFANQLGVQNVRTILAGQRITNQEMMTFLTRASASVNQPIGVMKSIIAWQKANNDYDRMAGATKVRAMQAPYLADPFQSPGVIESSRQDYVQKQMDEQLGAIQLTMPTGPKLQAYADKYTNGDANRAKAELSKHGYR